uniref:Retrotransposon gag domain-containing protein n=1 Tax=Daphnia galeata TaxID=27404 RepID=A0A8J2RXH5_9CRUS|nr:unnamed protein product [Daphnia galeata]
MVLVKEQTDQKCRPKAEEATYFQGGLKFVQRHQVLSEMNFMEFRMDAIPLNRPENRRLDASQVVPGNLVDASTPPQHRFLHHRSCCLWQTDLQRPHRKTKKMVQHPASPVLQQNIIPAVAMAAQRKFISPPTFSTKPGEDAQDWLERFELTGRYNHWDAAEMRSNFIMYLEGTARKWFLFSNVPADWGDQAAVAATPTAAAIPFLAGLRTTFFTEFRQDNFALTQEAKLRKRFQKENEDTASYYYDVLHMCHVINPAMTQTQILEHLYNGLRRSLVKKIYPLKPRTCAEFLELVKIHTETTFLLDKRSWEGKDDQVPPTAAISMGLGFKLLILERVAVLKPFLASSVISDG